MVETNENKMPLIEATMSSPLILLVSDTPYHIHEMMTLK